MRIRREAYLYADKLFSSWLSNDGVWHVKTSTCLWRWFMREENNRMRTFFSSNDRIFEAFFCFYSFIHLVSFGHFLSVRFRHRWCHGGCTAWKWRRCRCCCCCCRRQFFVGHLDHFELRSWTKSWTNCQEEDTEGERRVTLASLAYLPLVFSLQSHICSPWACPPKANVNGKSGLTKQVLILPYRVWN